MTHAIIVRDPEIMDGTAVFAGTRVPVKTLFDYLEKGCPLDEFLDDFPTVTREQAQQVVVQKVGCETALTVRP